MAREGERFYFYRADRRLLTFRREDVTAVRLACLSQLGRVAAAARGVRRIVAAERPAVIHSNSQKAHVFASLAAIATGTPVVWHMRDILPSGFARRLMDGLAAAAANRVIAISDAVGRQFTAARAKVAVVYNAVAPPEALSAEGVARVKRSWGIPRGARVVGCVGQLAPWKGQDVFVRAAARLAETSADIYFVIIGGPLYGAAAFAARLRREVKRAGLAPRFRFLGHRADGPRDIAALDVLVHMPLEPEPFGRVIVEAMARQVPVVAAATGGVPEIIADGAEGILVDAGDATAAAAAAARLLSDRRLAAAMGAHGRETYERRFTLERLSREVRLVYREVSRRVNGTGVIPKTAIRSPGRFQPALPRGLHLPPAA